MLLKKLGATLTTDAKPTYARYLWYGDYGEGKTYLTGVFNNMLKKHGTRGCFGMDFDGAMRNVLKSANIEMPVKTYVGPSAFSMFEEDVSNFSNKQSRFWCSCYRSSNCLRACCHAKSYAGQSNQTAYARKGESTSTWCPQAYKTMELSLRL